MVLLSINGTFSLKGSTYVVPTRVQKGLANSQSHAGSNLLDHVDKCVQYIGYNTGELAIPSMVMLAIFSEVQLAIFSTSKYTHGIC